MPNYSLKWAFVAIYPTVNFDVFLGIQREELKVKKSIKDAAKKGHVDVAKILAKELIQSRKATSKLYSSKAQMNSVIMTMQQQNGKGTTLWMMWRDMFHKINKFGAIVCYVEYVGHHYSSYNGVN